MRPFNIDVLKIMSAISWVKHWVVLGLFLFCNFAHSQAWLSIPMDLLNQPVKSWKSIRDEGIVKQDLDYSCGAAGLATILNEFYGQSVSEEALLEALDKGDARASFADMQRALPKFGFKAQGFAATYEQLLDLKTPVLVYLKYRTTEHFSVLKGVGENTVHLADPSLGHVTLSKSQFLNMWNNHGADTDNNLRGRFLAVLPINQASIGINSEYFDRDPVRKSNAAVQQLAHPVF